MLENIRLSFQGIWSHKMRSFLTMLGIIIGIASIISIVSTIQGTNEQIKKNLIGGGNNTVTVSLSQGDWDDYSLSDYDSLPKGVPVISEETKKEISDINGVEKVSLYTRRAYADGIYHQNTSLDGGGVYGVDLDYFSTCGYIMKTGRPFLQEDYKDFRKVAILDESAATSLFQDEDPLGKTIEIKGEPFTVIGVVVKSDQFEPVINSMEDYANYKGNEASGIVYLTSSAWCIPYQYDEPQNIVMKAESTDDMSTIGKKCADIVNASVTNTDNIKYKASDVLQIAKEKEELSAATNNQLLWIASISLLVGGIGVMNIMLVSVTERTSEIGLKKAIGAKKKSILGQFLTEAAVLTSLGGIIGVIAGIILAQAISKISQIPVAISVPAIIGSVIFSMLIGIIFGLLPSVKAAKLNPIDALRHE